MYILHADDFSFYCVLNKFVNFWVAECKHEKLFELEFSRGGHFKVLNSPLVDGFMAFVFEETPGGARMDTSSTRAPI